MRRGKLAIGRQAIPAVAIAIGAQQDVNRRYNLNRSVRPGARSNAQDLLRFQWQDLAATTWDAIEFEEQD